MGCSGGDTEGELEKKARRTYKLYELIGIAGMAAIGFGIVTGLSSYNKGHNEGYDEGYFEGNDIGYEAGRKAGLAEAGGANYIYSDENGAVVALRRFDEDGSVRYSIKTSETDGQKKVEEFALVITGENSNLYFDGDYAGKSSHDGLVDFIGTFPDNEQSYTRLDRSVDFEGNETLFFTADRILREQRERFSHPEF